MTTDTAIDPRVKQAFEQTGLTPQAAVKMQLDKLRTEGILIDLNITGTGMFQRTPNWVELGIPEFADDKRASQFAKGSKYVYPEEKVKKIKSFEARLRQVLEKNTYDITGFRPYRYLPYTAYQTWRAKHDSIVAEANAYIETEMIAKHAQNVDVVASAYGEIAEAAWLSATTGETDKGRRTQLYQYVQLWDKATKQKLTLDHDNFIDYIVKNAVSSIPTVDHIRARLKFDYTTALVYGQEDIEADRVNAERIRANWENERAQLDLSREYSRLENEQKREQVRAEAWRIQKEQQAFEEEKEAKIAAMRQAEYDHTREQLQQIVSPFAEVYKQAITQFIDHARDILESIRKNNHVRGKVADRGRGLLDVYNLLVIPGMGDDRMMQHLKDLRSMLGPVDEGAVRDTAAIEAKLQEIIGMEAQISEDLQSEPTTFGYLEL